YTQLVFDRCVFVKRGINGQLLSMACVHVDDLLAVDLVGEHKEGLEKGLIRAYGKVTVCDEDKLIYLGVHIECTPGAFKLHQRPLIEALDYPKLSRKPRNPAPADFMLVKSGQPAKDPERFRSTLMRILYISTRTRFDLMFIVNVLATKQQNSTVHDE